MRCSLCAINRVQWLRDINDFFGVRFKITPVGQHHAANIKQTPKHGEDGEDSSDSDADMEEKLVLGVKVPVKRGEDNKKVERYRPEEVIVSCVGIGYGNINRSTA